MTLTAHTRPESLEYVDTHRHTPSCFWDLHDARWRCAHARDAHDPAALPRLPRGLVEPRRRATRPERVDPPPTAPRVRTGAQPGMDDGC